MSSSPAPVAAGMLESANMRIVLTIVLLSFALQARAQGDTVIVPGDLNGDLITGPNADIYIGGDTGEIYAGNNTIVNAENVTLACPDGTDCKGDPGPQGPDGQQGEDGQDGTAGADGEDGKDGKDGAAGADGTDGNDGSKGAAGSVGATGPKGAVGPQGPQGPQGEPGEDAFGGVAGATALGRVEFPRQGQYVIGLGVGAYRDTTAIAIGAGKAWDHWSFDLGGFVDEEGYVGGAASVNYHFKVGD